MPIPTPTVSSAPLFPALSSSQIDATRTSSWYSTFRSIVHPASIIDLDNLGEKQAFLEWLEADSIFLPEDSQAGPSQPRPVLPPLAGESEKQDNDTEVDTIPGGGEDSDQEEEDEEEEEEEEERPVYKLPKLNEAIREAIKRRRGAVFPKLNWSSPKDAAFILPQTAHGPLHCTSPGDVYLLLKSSDFISHGLDPIRAYASGNDVVPPEDDGGDEEEEAGNGEIKLELVLKEFVEVNPSREFRCFVRNNVLIGVSQRDTNLYDHLQKPETQSEISDNIRAFWEDEMRDQHRSLGDDYTFDLYLTPDMIDAHLIDINPYRASTDPLGFTYTELQDILRTAQSPISSATDVSDDRPRLPILRVIDSPSHPAATSTAPAYSGNMMPVEMLEMSQGRSLEEFREAWMDAVARGMTQ